MGPIFRAPGGEGKNWGSALKGQPGGIKLGGAALRFCPSIIVFWGGLVLHFLKGWAAFIDQSWSLVFFKMS